MSSWPAHDYRALRAEQAALARAVVLEDDPEPPVRIGGFDAAYADRRGFGALAIAHVHPEAAVERGPAELIVAAATVRFPYVPGFLAYREAPMFDAVLARSPRGAPDVTIVDGSGLLHPTRFGQACHFGVRHDVATIGVSKRLFVGEVEGDVERLSPGDSLPILLDGEVCGYALRIGARSRKPVFVSPGHRVSVASALTIVKRVASPAHRLPWPQQMAHDAAGQARRQFLDEQP